MLLINNFSHGSTELLIHATGVRNASMDDGNTWYPKPNESLFVEFTLENINMDLFFILQH